ncbi:TPR domain-containing protein, putative [Eimeria necatrix]|uniref:TPR domain-containing protein, putative n=1 Tax=Eimeria necatrix TaxID=51315 RepID=U6N4M3_9EIME|nr:TPR domain-containing protein, putative [Eimeria necatrix]CDJ69655.1 TPR domain-containing protein, putative [Eimeria necatrix]
MADKGPPFRGSGIATVGGEAPVEQCPQEKFCVEEDSPLCDSIMWKMLDNYYKQVAIEAWAHDYVPSFVTSNSRLCRSYAKIIINFLQDWFRRPEADPTQPVTILEIGGGHGRFTFLLLRALQRYKRLFASLGLPERPFLVVFSDVAEANVDFCSKHPALKTFVEMQWLDFAIFDGNKDREVHLVVRNEPLTNGAAPVVAICNYVLDSLLTDSWRITPGACTHEFERSLVSIYSPSEEQQLDAPDIMLRMTLGWKWKGVNLDAACDPSNPEKIDYLHKDPTIKEVLLRYRQLNKQLSFVLPIGAFALFRNLSHIGGGRLFCLVGDKGYPTADEFVGPRDPHIAIHGSISFMLNLHAVRIFFECMGGFSHATPYRDTFQVTGLWLCGTEHEMGRSVAAFLEDVEDLAPDALINWQRAAQETVAAGGGPASSIKSLISLLRYSAHDADVFLNFSNEFTSQCVHPYLNPRTEHDLIGDLEETFANWYKLKKGEDVADVCGHICMRLGRCDKALKFLQASADLEPERTHPSTYVNLASCHKVEGKLEAGIKCCEKALQIDPNYTQAIQMLRTLNMCINPAKVALIGLGYWTQYEALPLLRRDTRLKIVAAFAFKQEDVATLVEKAELQGVELYSGSQGLSSLLERSDIQALVVDVHMQLMMSLLPRVFAAGKHLLTRSPLQMSLSSAAALLDIYKPYCNSVVWHAVENNRQEEAFVEAAAKLATLGRVTSVSFRCGTDTALKYKFSTAPYDIKHHMALDLLRCVTALRQITGLQMSSLSAVAKGDHAPCCGSPSSQLEDKPDKIKNTRLRREYARLSGWLTFVNPSSHQSVLGSFVISHCVGDNSLTYKINCLRGTMKLTKASSCWRIDITGEKVPGGTSFAVQSIGHQNCHDAFAEELYEKLRSTEKSTGGANSEEGPTLVDISINGALADSAIIEGILASMQNDGAPARFGSPVSEAVEGHKKMDKKSASLRSVHCYDSTTVA